MCGMAAFNGRTLREAVLGICVEPSLPLEWTAVVQGTAFTAHLASKGITPHRTVVVYDAEGHRSAALATGSGSVGYARE
jgi:hypothetical protein